MKQLFLFLVLIGCSKAQAQHENDNWYFGNYAAISFLGGSPVNLPTASMTTVYSCASISDSSGALLFYTNGRSVYDSNHVEMPNGDGLNAGYSSQQPVLIVKDPLNIDEYYLFTTPDNFSGTTTGFCYSKVDMSLNNGLGDVTLKNIQLLPDCDQKIAGIRNGTNDGFWILIHIQPNDYYAYPVTIDGVGQPVVSTIGFISNEIFPEQGQLKISPNGQFIAHCITRSCAVELASFNNITGEVSNTFVYQLPISQNNFPNGIEFSLSGNRLYISRGSSVASFLSQMDISSGDSTTILNSLQLIYSDSEMAGQIQRAPDGKLYVAQFSQNHLGVIDMPDSLGLQCNYYDTALTLNSECRFGLPNFIWNSELELPSPFAEFDLNSNNICQNSCVSFLNQSLNAGSFYWEFPGGSPSFSFDPEPVICYADTGLFEVLLIASNASANDTLLLQDFLHVTEPNQAIGILSSSDTLICISSQPTSLYQWYFNGLPVLGAIDSFFYAAFDGLYMVTVINSEGCIGMDSIYVIKPSVEVIRPDRSFQISPNPTSESFTIKTSHQGVSRLSIYNTLGQRVANKMVEREQHIDVSYLPTGVYHVTVEVENDFFSQRLLVSRH
jgi:PKD repeat protein